MRSAQRIVPMLLEAFCPRSVVDVGCGLGAWLSVFRERGGITDLCGYDGDYVDRSRLLISTEEFVAHDLSTPIHAGRKFDLVLCLEVAEHLPEASADALVGSLCGLGDVVYFSAAIPFQGGVAHVNEQWPSYWAGKFEKHGLEPIDLVRQQVWSDPTVQWWYAQNGIVYGRTNIIRSHPRLQTYSRQKDLESLNLVHPTQYLAGVDPQNISLRRALRLVGTSLKRISSRYVGGRSRDKVPTDE